MPYELTVIYSLKAENLPAAIEEAKPFLEDAEILEIHIVEAAT